MVEFVAGVVSTLAALLALLWLTTDPPPDHPSIGKDEEDWGE